MHHFHLIKNHRGFTMVELMIVLAISGVILAGAYIAFKNQQESFTVQDQVNMTQQNLRATMEIIKHDLQMGGFASFWDLEKFRADWDNADGDDDVTTGTENIRPIVYSVDNAGASDAITVIKADPTRVRTMGFTELGSGNNLKLDSYTDFNAADTFGVLVSDDITHVEVFMVTATGDPVSITTERASGANALQNDYDQDDMVFPLDTVIYSVDGNMNLLRNGQIIAENIEMLQFQYVGEDEDGNVIVVDDVADFDNGAADMLAIDVSLLVRTERQDSDYVDTHPYQMGNEVIPPYMDNFRRKVLKCRVMTRNTGLI